MNLKKFVVGVGDVNCYILSDENQQGIIVDPGGNAGLLIDYIKENKINLEAIILTHYHYDHILAVEKLKEELNLPVWIHKKDVRGLSDPELNLSASRPIKEISIEADRELNDGDVIEVGKLKLEIIHTPGHTPGGICIKIKDFVLTGDTLFKNSVGRTDLTGGSYEELTNSITKKLLPLSDKLTVYPGHYYQSNLGREKKQNPKIQRML